MQFLLPLRFHWFSIYAEELLTWNRSISQIKMWFLPVPWNPRSSFSPDLLHHGFNEPSLSPSEIDTRSPRTPNTSDLRSTHDLHRIRSRALRILRNPKCNPEALIPLVVLAIQSQQSNNRESKISSTRTNPNNHTKNTQITKTRFNEVRPECLRPRGNQWRDFY